MTIAAIFLILMVAVRIYRGRNFNKGSRPMGWALAVLGGVTLAWTTDPATIRFVAASSALAFWCIGAGYDGWDKYWPMALRSLPAAGIIPLAVAAQWFGVDASGALAAVVMCFCANVTQVPIRRLQHRIDQAGHRSDCAVNNAPAYAPGSCDCGQNFKGNATAIFAEGWEAMWVAGAIVVLARGG